MSEEMVELTETILIHCGTAGHGFSNYQISLLGETPTKGWKSRVIGKKFPLSVINELYKVKGIKTKKVLKTHTDNSKQPNLFDL